MIQRQRIEKKKEKRNGYLTFMKEYCRNLKTVGSIVPDSNVCYNSMLKHVPFDSADLILEFGAGSGTVTKEIIRRKRPETVFMSFEKNKTFFNRLSSNVSGDNVHFTRDDVFNSVSTLAAEVGMKHNGVDCIVSTLPCSSIKFDTLVQDAVIPLLKDGGFFIQYMHSLSLLKGFRAKPILKKHFNQVRSGFVFLNVPPVFIYTCRKAENGRAREEGRAAMNREAS